VGIGTTDPSAQKLVVVGNIRAGASGTLGCLENFAGTGLVGTCSSDASLKTVIGNVGSVLDKLASLDLVNYRWNQTAVDLYHKSPDAINTGYLAQQVQAQFPELVSTDEKGFEQLNYTTLSLYGLEAIKELYAQIQPFTGVLSIVPGVESQCVTGDTQLRRKRKGAKRDGNVEQGGDEFDEIEIKNIAVGDEIQSLDERTGRAVYSRVNALIDMGEQEVFELKTASGRTIRTTSNHPFLAREGATQP
ncbi:MAG: tail fiber domain-containing protein, partial [Candidatus Kaiserbacteria bacterium]|nr:tail fiber domain-containing protein [Candidatus Kaiserbacteria bacterium]